MPRLSWSLLLVAAMFPFLALARNTNDAAKPPPNNAPYTCDWSYKDDAAAFLEGSKLIIMGFTVKEFGWDSRTFEQDGTRNKDTCGQPANQYTSLWGRGPVGGATWTKVVICGPKKLQATAGQIAAGLQMLENNCKIVVNGKSRVRGVVWLLNTANATAEHDPSQELFIYMQNY